MHPLTMKRPTKTMQPLMYTMNTMDGCFVRIFYLDLIVSKYGIGDFVRDTGRSIITVSDLHTQITTNANKLIRFNNSLFLIPAHVESLIASCVRHAHIGKSWTPFIGQNGQLLTALSAGLDQWIY